MEEEEEEEGGDDICIVRWKAVTGSTTGSLSLIVLELRYNYWTNYAHLSVSLSIYRH